MRSSRAYDAVYRGNTSPLKSKPKEQQYSAHKKPSAASTYQTATSYNSHLSNERLESYNQRDGMSYRAQSPASPHYERVGSSPKPTNQSSASKLSVRKTDAEIAALADNFKRYLKARP